MRRASLDTRSCLIYAARVWRFLLVLGLLSTALGCVAKHVDVDGGTPAQDAGLTPVDAGAVLVDGIRFSPSVLLLGNPSTPAGQGRAQSFTLTVTVFDDAGSPSAPSPSNPVRLDLYGPGVVTLSSIRLTQASLTLTYDGGYFGAPMSVTAQQGRRVGVLPLVGESRTCDLGAAELHLPLACKNPPCGGTQVIEDGLFLHASVGAGPVELFQIDTGSEGLVMPAAELGPDAIGPGAPAVVFYDSSGYEFSGNYYLARVSFVSDGGSPLSASTIPMLVLGTTSTACHPGYPSCVPPTNDVHLLGAGFDRAVVSSALEVNRPQLNPLLQLEAVVTGNALSPGYVLSAGSTGVGDSVVVGVTPARKGSFDWFRLTSSTTAPGDWQPAPGCYAFPGLGAGPFCGTMLVDTGVPEMFLNLPDAQRPRELATGIPSGTQLQVTAPSSSDPALGYQFTFLSPATSGPPTVTPVHLLWGGNDRTFVNTGRHLLAGYDYLFDAACGAVGFAPSNALTR